MKRIIYQERIMKCARPCLVSCAHLCSSHPFQRVFLNYGGKVAQR